MKLRNLGLALTAVCATVAGVVGTANNAYAGTATADINFSGSMSEACAFTGVGSGSVAMNANQISANNYGKATVTCYGTGTITLSDPIQTSGTSLTFTSTAATVLTGTGTDWLLQSPSSGSAGWSLATSRTVSSKTENYLIYMYMTTPDLIPAGNYGFKTTLTATY
jgi:hypothetical protein